MPEGRRLKGCLKVYISDQSQLPMLGMGSASAIISIPVLYVLDT